jgi:3-hydroxybutyrate dehydrogenase
MRLAGRRVLVTGASRGIGAAVAEAFVAAGAAVHVLAETDEVTATAERIGAVPHRADITRPEAVARVLGATGPLDVLVNNAGLERLTPLAEMDAAGLATFRRILEVNVVGTAIVTGAAQTTMPPGSAVINTASIWGRVAEPLFGAYVASKHAVIGLTKTWAKELGPKRITVNAVCPGGVRPAAPPRAPAELARRNATSEAAVLDAVAASQALPGGVMAPGDVVGPYLFLASPLAADITGQTLGIDRGEVPW